MVMSEFFSRLRSLLQGLIVRPELKILLATLVLWVGCAGMEIAIAAPNSPLALNLLQQPPTEVTISLGNAANELKFVPNRLDFVAGKRYKLILTNPSQQKHYFTAKDFADILWTQKVEAGDVEIKGAIHELELKPGATADWTFIPIKPGNYALHCSVPGHTEAGMTGSLVVSVEPQRQA
jgi:uncharacterized cupredoxin-like copper-binding protein